MAVITGRIACSMMATDVDEGRLGGLDGLRGFLAVGVLIAHFPLALQFAQTNSWQANADPIFATFGLNAVALFFMVTSFLFYGKIRRSEPQSICWTTLYWRRLLRLFPMYLVAILVMIIISFAHQGFYLIVSPFDLAGSLFKWLTFTLISPERVNNYHGSAFVLAGVIWTLRYEWLFYAILPVLAALVYALRRWTHWLLAFAVLSALLCAISSDWSIRDFGPRRFGSFFLGMIVVEILRSETLTKLLRSPAGAVPMVLGLVGMFAFKPFPYGIGHCLCLLMLFSPIAAGFDFYGLLMRKELRLIGDASYSFYLLHGITLHMAFWAFKELMTISFDTMMLVVLPILAAVTSMLSIVTYRFVEIPFIAFGRTRHVRTPATAEVM